MPDTPELLGKTYNDSVAESISATDDYDFSGAVIKVNVVEFVSLVTTPSAIAKFHPVMAEAAAAVDTPNSTMKTGVHVTEATSGMDTPDGFAITNVIDYATLDDASDVGPITRNAQIVEFASAGTAIIMASVIFNVSIIEAAATAETTNIGVGDWVYDAISFSDATSIIIPPALPGSQPPFQDFPSSKYIDKQMREQKQLLKYIYTPIWKE